MDPSIRPEWFVGLRVRIRTSLGEDVEGEIFTFDANTNCVVLQEKVDESKSNFRILKANFIKEIQCLGPVQEEPDLRVPTVSISKLRVKEDTALRQARIDAARIGVGVSAEGQEIFDALTKTMPVRWEKDTIVVFDDIRILKPYNGDNATGQNQAALTRVRKVLELEWKRILRRNQTLPAGTSPAGPS